MCKPRSAFDSKGKDREALTDQILKAWQAGGARNPVVLDQHETGLLRVLGSAKHVGAAAGNMIAIHNVVAAAATVGLLGQEGMTLRKTIIPTLYYLIAIGILGMIAVYVLHIPDPMMN